MPRRVVIVALAAALLAAMSGCGEGGEMSLSEYRTSISELHDGVAWDLGVALETLNGLSFDDYYDLPEMRDAFAAAEVIFASAWDTADPMYPPREAEPLHVDLLEFYAEGAAAMRGVQDSIGFLEAALPMLQDVENLAIPALPEGAGEPEIKAAAAEDRRSMEGYLKEMDGMYPPRELQAFRDKLTEFFRSIDDAVAAVDQAVRPEDLSPFPQFRAWFTTAIEDARALWSEAVAFLGALGAAIDEYIEQGKELAARIQLL